MKRVYLLFVLGAALSVNLSAATPERPNVLFIAVDDMNDWVGPLEDEEAALTPNMDALSASGEVFSRAYCSSPACNPSRTAILTGMSAATTGIYLNDQPWRPHMPDVVTLPQLFRENGYLSVGLGKIYHNRYNGDKASWDVYKRFGHGIWPEDPVETEYPGKGQYDWGPVDAPDPAFGDYNCATEAVKFLSEPQDRPFFLGVGFIRPHLPFYCPPRFFDLYPMDEVVMPEVKDDDLEDIPLAGKKTAWKYRGPNYKKMESQGDIMRRAIQAYRACISFTDEQVGRVLDALKNSPYADNTIVVLWSDHGFHLGEKQHFTKYTLWEESDRVLLIFRVPGVTEPGTVSSRTVSLLDLYPTLAQLCELKDVPTVLEGRSLVPLMKDPEEAWPYPAVTTNFYGNHAVRSERWRYIRYENGDEELYDHDVDPNEWTNLANDPAYASVKTDLAQWLPTTNAPNAPREEERKH
ncbi:sulfatase [Ruficoccus sp. ZRK36]|uniref:sulfatase n=1 Tax=Ruficoccus sp. ZRK36 TaxID=2866311 RepID=UPI001C736384|nr:sulfatase [Ruficoccus sp. ZRK36]QYY34420.1 sulfatase [Ruficoccus sp. ZRK36]